NDGGGFGPDERKRRRKSHWQDRQLTRTGSPPGADRSLALRRHSRSSTQSGAGCSCSGGQTRAIGGRRKSRSAVCQIVRPLSRLGGSNRKGPCESDKSRSHQSNPSHGEVVRQSSRPARKTDAARK